MTIAANLGTLEKNGLSPSGVWPPPFYNDGGGGYYCEASNRFGETYLSTTYTRFHTSVLAGAAVSECLLNIRYTARRADDTGWHFSFYWYGTAMPSGGAGGYETAPSGTLALEGDLDGFFNTFSTVQFTLGGLSAIDTTADMVLAFWMWKGGTAPATTPADDRNILEWNAAVELDLTAGAVTPPAVPVHTVSGPLLGRDVRAIDVVGSTGEAQSTAEAMLARARWPTITVQARLKPEHWAAVREGDLIRVVAPPIGLRGRTQCGVYRVLGRAYRSDDPYLTLDLQWVQPIDEGLLPRVRALHPVPPYNTGVGDHGSPMRALRSHQQAVAGLVVQRADIEFLGWQYQNASNRIAALEAAP